jgi:hypothetical protein
MAFFSCATTTANRYAVTRRDLGLDVVAGFAHAECQSKIDEYIASLGLTYTDRVYVTSSLNRRAALTTQRIALDAMLRARG